MAVPFRACDTPSERAEFKHPDAAICKTQLAYYQTGLQQGQLRDALQAILSLPLVQGRQVYRCWHNLVLCLHVIILSEHASHDEG